MRLYISWRNVSQQCFARLFVAWAGAPGAERIGSGDWDGSDVVFSSVDQRERFAGQVRAFVEEAAAVADAAEADEIIRNGVDVYVARTLVVPLCGVVGRVLTRGAVPRACRFCTTWNVSEGKPPAPDIIGTWIPKGFHMCVSGMRVVLSLSVTLTGCVPPQVCDRYARVLPPCRLPQGRAGAPGQ